MLLEIVLRVLIMYLRRLVLCKEVAEVEVLMRRRRKRR
jgi:hypothetical protein